MWHWLSVMLIIRYNTELRVFYEVIISTMPSTHTTMAVVNETYCVYSTVLITKQTVVYLIAGI